MTKNKYILVTYYYCYFNETNVVRGKIVNHEEGGVSKNVWYVDSLEEAKKRRRFDEIEVPYGVGSLYYQLNYSNDLVFDAYTKEIVSDPAWLFDTEKMDPDCYPNEMIKKGVKIEIREEFWRDKTPKNGWWSNSKIHKGNDRPAVTNPSKNKR